MDNTAAVTLLSFSICGFLSGEEWINQELSENIFLSLSFIGRKLLGKKNIDIWEKSILEKLKILFLA